LDDVKRGKQSGGPWNPPSFDPSLTGHPPLRDSCPCTFTLIYSSRTFARFAFSSKIQKIVFENPSFVLPFVGLSSTDLKGTPRKRLPARAAAPVPPIVTRVMRGAILIITGFDADEQVRRVGCTLPLFVFEKGKKTSLGAHFLNPPPHLPRIAPTARTS
jgi:hypothetical protein